MKAPNTIVEIAATGVFLPERTLTNADLEKMVDTSDEWITTRTGIKERRLADENTSAADMGAGAARAALANGDLDPADVDAIIVSTATPDRLLPAMACDIQAMIGARNAVGFDISGACPGWLFAVNVAQGLIGTDQAKTVLIVAAEKLSTIVDWTDRATCVLWGDAAAATVIRRSQDERRGILSTYMRSDGMLADLLYRPPARGLNPAIPVDAAALDDDRGFLRMAGREVFKAAVRSMNDAADAALKAAGVSPSDIDLLIPHQANVRIIESTARYAGIPMERVLVNIDRYGNTSSASIPIALHEAVACGRIHEGSLLLLVAFGAGFTWASAVIRW